MKLLTYNFLTSKCIKKVKVGYPLKLNVIQKSFPSNEKQKLKNFVILDRWTEGWAANIQSRVYSANAATIRLECDKNSCRFSWMSRLSRRDQYWDVDKWHRLLTKTPSFATRNWNCERIPHLSRNRKSISHCKWNS